MLVLRQHGFAFIHIPKNAGSSVRNQIQHLDEDDGAFQGTKHHPEIGPYDSSHMPLDLLARIHPDVLADIRGLTSYAVTRDPVDRFISALAQRARQIHAIAPDRMDDALITADIDAGLAAAASRGVPARDLVFFLPQSRFVDLDGARVVDHLYSVDTLPALTRAIEAHIGQPLIADFHANRTVTFRNPAMAGPLTRAKDAAKAVLPLGVYDRVRRAAMSVFTTTGVDRIDRAVRQSETVMSALGEVYARDFELCADVARSSGDQSEMSTP